MMQRMSSSVRFLVLFLCSVGSSPEEVIELSRDPFSIILPEEVIEHICRDFARQHQDSFSLRVPEEVIDICRAFFAIRDPRYQNVDTLVTGLSSVEEMALVQKLNTLEAENKQLRKVTNDQKALVLSLEAKVGSLEGGEKKCITEERLKAYHEKKSKKPQVIAKTSVLFDVKSWDDETDYTKMLEACKSITKDGLVWGASKIVPIGYGIKKLQIMCTVEDAKVSIEELGEQMEAFEDYVQSVDVAAMNKI